MDKKNKDLIIKDNALNSYTFYKSAVQLKIFWKLIVEISQDPKKEVYRIPINNLLKEINFKNKWNSELKNRVRKMMQSVEIPQEEGFEFATLFYNIKTKDSTYLDFEVNPKLKPYLLALNGNFTKYHFENITTLKSYYSIRIYELLKQFESTWKWFVTLEKLKENLKIDPKKYKLYWDFKRYVLKTAQRELAEKTDIKFTFEEHRIIKKVDRLIFYIWKNIKTKISSGEKKKAILPPLKSTKKETKEQLEIIKLWTEKLKLGNQFLNEIFKTYEGAEKRILDNLKHTIKKFEQGKIKESLGGYFRTALKNDYAKQMQLLDPKEEQKKQAIKEKNKILSANELYKKFNTYKTQKIEEYKKENSKELKNLVPIFIIKNLKILELNKIDFENIEEVEKATKKHKFIKSIFNIFIEKTKLKNDIWTFEEWAKNKNIIIWKNTNWDYIIK